MSSDGFTLCRRFCKILSLCSLLFLGPLPHAIAQTDWQTPSAHVLTVASQNTQDAQRVEPEPFPGFTGIDQQIPKLMEKWNLPGGAIAISKDEKLVFATGYGLAAKETGQAVQPDSLFRIGSVSKPITAVAILKLIEDGKLNLETRAFQFLGHLQPAPKAKIDPRVQQITIRQLLYHSGGWDQQKSFDPMGHFREAANTLNVPLPVSAEAVIRYMLGRSLDFDPGTRHAYSNFGYCVLGRVIEKASGQSYEEYVCEHLLRTAGITRMRIGRTLPEHRYPGEVHYYSAAGVSMIPSALSSQGERVPIQYGGYYLESMDSHGGWIASAIDLVRFLTAVDGRNGRPGLLKPETIDLMLARPEPPLWVGTPVYYGMGWNVRPLKRGVVWYHTGALAGSSLAVIVRTPKGLSWAALFNSIPASISEVAPFFVELDRTIAQALDQVTVWPAHDLFPQYP